MMLQRQVTILNEIMGYQHYCELALSLSYMYYIAEVEIFHHAVGTLSDIFQCTVTLPSTELEDMV